MVTNQLRADESFNYEDLKKESWMEDESFNIDNLDEQHVYPMFTTLDELIEELGKEVGSVEMETVHKSSNSNMMPKPFHFIALKSTVSSFWLKLLCFYLF